MALTVTSLTHGADVSGVTITTASVTPGSNNLELFILFSNNVIPTNLSISGNGLTWVPLWTDSNQGSNRAMNIWRALGPSPVAGGVVITNPSSCVFMWDYLEVSGGVDTTTPVLQTTSVFGASPTDAGLAASLATSALIGVTGDRDSSSTLTAGAGYTALNRFGNGSIGVLGTEWLTGSTTGACSWGWDSGNSHSVFGFEVQVSTGPPPPPGDTFVAAWGMQAPAINRGKPVMVASGSRPGTQVS